MRRRPLARCSRLLPFLLVAAGCPKEPAPTPPTDATPPATADADADPATDENLPDAQEILTKSIDAVGGKDAIEAIASSYSESKTVIKAQNMTVMTRTWTKGDNMYMESDMPGMGMSQVWKKGDDIWSKDPINGLRKLEGKEAEQAKWSGDPMLAVNWADYFDKAETTGVEEIDGRKVVRIELSRESGEAITLLFDAETAMPVGQEFQSETPMGKMPVRVILSDYREVGGVQMAFKSVSEMSVVSTEQTTEKMDINVDIDDAKFEPPKK